VPQLGRVRASGRTVQSFESLLTRRLSDVLINPTAIVQLVERQSATVSVVGRVSSGGTYPINLSTRRLLDVIGTSGGPTSDTEGLVVSLSRDGVEYRALLEDIYGNKALNIFVRDGDLISIEPEITRVQVLGATGGNDVLEFDEAGVTLIDVITKAGGLMAPRAARKGVFVFREAPRHQLAALGASLEEFPGYKNVPTVFRIDLTDPNALFTSKNFRMMDDDIVYVADSLSQQISDFFGSASNIAPTPAEYVRDNTIGD
jgi:polysaccharide export outer membrane protein